MWQWKKEEAWGTGLLILIAMGGYVAGLSPGGSQSRFDNAALSSPSNRVMIGCLVLGALFPVVARFRSVLRGAFAFLPLVPYLTIAVASILWSENPQLSLRRVLTLLATSLFGLYFAVRFSQRTQVRMLLAATSLLALATVLLVLIAPQYAIDRQAHSGAWQGVFYQKNACAMVMVIGLAAGLIYQPCSIVTRVWKVVSLILFSVIILKSDSSGALLLMMGTLTLAQALRWLSRFEMRARMLLCLILAVFSCLTGFIVLQFIPETLKLLNRDPTLTGRTALWAQVWQSILERPILGYGYGAFWTEPTGPSARIAMAVGWGAPHAHNGFLDIWLSLGLLGVGAFCLVMMQCVRRLWQLIQSCELNLNLWLVISLFLVVLYNLDESVLIATPSLMWALLVSCVCGLELYARQSLEVRRYRRLPVGRPPLNQQMLQSLTAPQLYSPR